jgi:hypothetical protein
MGIRRENPRKVALLSVLVLSAIFVPSIPGASAAVDGSAWELWVLELATLDVIISHRSRISIHTQ